jgi:hypothetical protein
VQTRADRRLLFHWGLLFLLGDGIAPGWNHGAFQSLPIGSFGNFALRFDFAGHGLTLGARHVVPFELRHLGHILSKHVTFVVKHLTNLLSHIMGE